MNNLDLQRHRALSIDEKIKALGDETALELIHRLSNKIERLTVFVMAQQSIIDEMARARTQHLRDADLDAVKRGDKPGFDNIALWKKDAQ